MRTYKPSYILPRLPAWLDPVRPADARAPASATSAARLGHIGATNVLRSATRRLPLRHCCWICLEGRGAYSWATFSWVMTGSSTARAHGHNFRSGCGFKGGKGVATCTVSDRCRLAGGPRCRRSLRAIAAATHAIVTGCPGLVRAAPLLAVYWATDQTRSRLRW